MNSYYYKVSTLNMVIVSTDELSVHSLEELNLLLTMDELKVAAADAADAVSAIDDSSDAGNCCYCCEKS